jgi:hypothetical protein
MFFSFIWVAYCSSPERALHSCMNLGSYQVTHARLPIPFSPTSHSPFRPVDLRLRPLTANAVMALRLPKLNLIPVASKRIDTDHIAHAYIVIN